MFRLAGPKPDVVPFLSLLSEEKELDLDILYFEFDLLTRLLL